MDRAAMVRDKRGLTLVEVLVAIAVLGILTVAIAAMGWGGTTEAAKEAVRRDADANTVELASTYFATDVQGASGITATHCGTGLGGAVLVSLLSPPPAGTTGATATITYRAIAGVSGHRLVRARCSTGSAVSSEVVADELAAQPRVSCAQGDHLRRPEGPVRAAAPVGPEQLGTPEPVGEPDPRGERSVVRQPPIVRSQRGRDQWQRLAQRQRHVRDPERYSGPLCR